MHASRSRFRWIVILEIIVAVPCICLLIPLFVLVASLSEDSDLEPPRIRGRFFEKWHEIIVTALDPAGSVIASGAFRPTTADEGDALLATVLTAADRADLLVIETIEASRGGVSSSPAEPVEVWYGGRPLLA